MKRRPHQRPHLTGWYAVCFYTDIDFISEYGPILPPEVVWYDPQTDPLVICYDPDDPRTRGGIQDIDEIAWWGAMVHNKPPLGTDQ